MENFKLIRNTASLLAIILLGYVLQADEQKMHLNSKSPQSISSQPNMKEEKNSNREPASALILKAEIYKPGITRSEIKQSDFLESSVPNNFDTTSKNESFHVAVPSFGIPLIPANTSYKIFEETKEAQPTKKVNDNNVSISPSNNLSEIPLKKNPPISFLSTPNSSNDQNTNELKNICSANIAGGSFGHPIGVTLSCTQNSVIYYCVAVDSGNGCCDPFNSGTTYTTKIGIGSENEDYCLSYYGDSSTTGITDVYQHNYSFNSQLPDLQVGHQMIQYQTTQLPGKINLTSSDFGKSGYATGLINLKTHDPSPAFTNLKCSDIAEFNNLQLTPSPTEILPLLDVSLENPATQLGILFNSDQLDYGQNFLTSYMLNDNFDLPLYSCSTSVVTFLDFELFEYQLTFGDVGNNSVREFTGGLTSLGFFEPEDDIYRIPAGSSSEELNGQKLQYGMMGIFY